MRASLLLIALAACGKVSTLADGAPSDTPMSNADANVNVTVTVLDPQSGAPVSGVPVVFTDAGGSTLGHPTTDSSGKASQAMPAGGSITAVLPSGTNAYQMQTVLGVKAGDAITLNLAPVDNTAANYTVSLSPYAGADHYYVYGPCGQQLTSTTSTTLMFNAYCEVAQMDLIAIAYNAAGNPLAYVNKSGVAYSAGGSTTMPASWQGFATFTATATNLTSDVTSAFVARYWPDEFGYSAGNSATIGGTSASASLSGPTSAMAVVETTLGNGSGSIQRIRQRNSGASTAYNLDVGNNELAWVGPPTLDLATGIIKTPVTGSSHGTVDIFAANVHYARTVGTTSTSYYWTVYAPDVGDITLPTLPPEVGDVGPKAGDTQPFGNSAQLADFDTVSGYDAAHLKPTAVIDEYYGDYGRGPATARYSQSPLLK
jgi:hypothetical protein